MKKEDKGKNIFITSLIALISTLIFVIIIIILINNINKVKCNQVIDEIKKETKTYVLNNASKMPQVNGDYITVDLKEMNEIKHKEKVILGKVKITKVEDKLFYTYLIDNMKKCSISKKAHKKDTNKNTLKDVEAKYNYYKVTYNNSYWSDYINSDDISEDETLGVHLPKDNKVMPEISPDAIITGYIKEDTLKYRNRKKLYSWYSNPNNSYSSFSSEKPDGYSNKDERVVKETPYSEWNTTYPDNKSYRNIEKNTGYMWINSKTKEIYNNGEYLVDAPSDEYVKDRKKTITMYRYKDKMWKWYNGAPRGYSYGKQTKGSSRDKYYDPDTLEYTNWSNYSFNSAMNNENRSYLEEESKTFSRYKIQYKLRSFPILDKPVDKETLEKNIGKSLTEIANDPNYELEISYTYYY